MPANIEIKARVQNLDNLKKKGAELSNVHMLLKQTDVFYRTVNGCRLKMRTEEDLKADTVKSQLIAYRRPDVLGPKYSYYVLSEVKEPTTMESVLELANGEMGRVEKIRDVYLVTRDDLTARVHLDSVTDLGDFLEFEIIVHDNSQIDDANVLAKKLSDEFGIEEKDHIAVAYFNMLQDLKNQHKDDPTPSSTTKRATTTAV